MAGYLGFEATDAKPFIFISYNTEDQVRLSKITTALREHQINIWYDNGIHRISDEEWQEQIAVHIRDAEIVFFFLTQGIFEKKSSFVRKEYDLATRHAKKICIVMLDEINPALIPARYDFWWGDICNRQCIEATRLSEVSIADEIYKECCRAGIVNTNKQSQSGSSGSSTQPETRKKIPTAIIAIPVIFIVLIGMLGYRALSGTSKRTEKPPATITATTSSAGTADTSTAADTSTSSDAETSTVANISASSAADTSTVADTSASSAADTSAAPEDASTAGSMQSEHIYTIDDLPKSLPDDFHLFRNHTYAFYDASRFGFTDYKQIADFCREQRGHLAVINDAAENSYLFKLLRETTDSTAFFGYSDEDNEGDWKWSDGDSSFTNWTTYGDWSLPDNGIEYGGDEDYAEFNYEKGKYGIPSDGSWNDADFMENTTLFICEWDYDVQKVQEELYSQ